MGSHIDKWELFDQLGYKPHSVFQRMAHQSEARFRIACCGRRWGKSTAFGHEMTARMFVPNTYHWIVGPTYSLGEKEFRVVHNDLVLKLGLGSKIKKSYNLKQGDMSIRMPWNTVLEVKSADRLDSLVGEGLDSVCMSEAALHHKQTWEMYIEPALSDKRGVADFPSTPRGYNWFQGLWQLGQDSETDTSMYESWRFPTWTNAAMFPGGRDDPEIKRIESQVSRSHFMQEYAAEFTAFEGQIYEEWDPLVHIKDIEYNPTWLNFLAFDFGYKDPFCCYDIMVDPSDNVYVWREYQISGLNTWEHCQVLKNRESPPGYHVDNMFADPRGADEISTVTMLMGSVVALDVPWIQGIECVKRWLKIQPDGMPKFVSDHTCVHLNRQMEQLRHKEVKDGQNVKREGQHDYDDHGPDTVRYFMGPYFVMGANSHLSDLYDPANQRSEAATFFQLHKGFTRESGLVPFGR